MKSQFAHYKNRATGFGMRGIAVMLCFVMLLTAIGAGTMMTAFSAKADLTGSTAIVDTAQKVVDIANSVDTEAEDTEVDQSILPDLSKKIADLADTGANVDLAGSGYNLNTGARIYFNAEAWGNNVENYVYCAFLCNNSNYYQIIKLDHIANTYLYTQTTTGHVNNAGDMSSLFFFTTNQSGWACTSSSKYDSAYGNVTGNIAGANKNYTLTYGADVYNNHVYYYKVNGSAQGSGLTLTADKDSGDDLAQSTTYLKAGAQKASVYVSTTDKNINSFSYAGSASVGGDVQVSGYYWNTNFTVAKSTAPSSKSNSASSNYYSQYDTPALTSWITMELNEVYDGWTFVGWYIDGEMVTDETIYYEANSATAKDVKACFFKPTYETTGTPASASSLSSGKLIFKRNSSWSNFKSFYGWNFVTTAKTFRATQKDSTDYFTYTDSTNITSSKSPSAIAFNHDYGSEFTGYPNDGDSYKNGGGNITKNGTNTTGIYYIDLANDTTNCNWTNFEHLGVSLSGNPATADPGEEITLTATPSGTLTTGAKYNYYFQKNGEGSWYVIGTANTTETSVDFYPPDYGSYTFKVTVTDEAGFETAVANSSTTTNVGQVGYYVSGDTALVGSNWGVAPYKGFMTEPSSGTVWTKTFGNVASGSHEFRITSLTEWITSSSTHGTYTVNGVAGSMSGNNFTFTLSDNQQVTITYDSSNHNVTVTTSDVQAIDVDVYAGAGGFVEVSYGSATTEIPENDHMIIKVAYGDKIRLEATPSNGYSFSKWYKNLEEDYKGGKTEGYDSLENEVITSRTVYVATFTTESTDSNWIYSYDRSNATPEIGGDASSYNIIYSGQDSGVGRNEGDPKGSTATYKSGNDYWADLTSIFGNPPSTPNRLYIALANGTGNNNMVGDSSTKINGSTYSDGNGPTIKNSSDETLFIVRKKQNSTVHNTIRFIEIDGIDWTKISALGVRAVYSGSGSVNYKFYYKLKGESGSTSADYIPSTNFYAKDSSIREGNYNFWIYAPTTKVTNVEGQVRVDNDHANGHHWVDGFALKGSQITVTTIIPHRGSYNYVDKSGGTGTCYADEKYYVAGFSFNGDTPEMISESSGVFVSSCEFTDPNGVSYTRAGTSYTCTYTIPADMKESMLEITPILFVKDAYASETVMVYINGYSDEVRNAGWGNTLYLYPFYQYRKDGTADGEIASYYGQGENFGRYPGQPIVNYGGQLFAQIPLTDDASKNGKDSNGGPVKGITINNGYYDDVHKNYCNHVSVHRQTYDFDDFAKIYNEKKTKNGSKYMYSIYFSFKYFPVSSSQHRLAGTTNGIDGDSKASRYNDLLADGNILDDITGTVAAATLEDAGNNSTGWQYLTDALGNNVDIFGDKITKPSADPLRIFSLGYEYNNAGRWATEWAVYHKNGSNYELLYNSSNPMSGGSDNQKTKATNSSIVPSALIYNTKADLAAATSMDGDKGINEYAGLYENIEAYRGVPALICYEHDIPDAFNPKNYRCDGRWTYTTVEDFVKSNIKIQYYDVNGELHDDSFEADSHIGSTTKCSAYFTNSDYYGATESESELIDHSKSYTFTAEEKGSYEFVGWYMYDTSGLESTITTSSTTADTPRSGNFTLAARFKYIASGNLTISNSLHANSTGRGTTYLGVTVKNGDKETVVANVNSNTKTITLDKSIINARSNYQIIVTVKTVPTGENTFKEYTAYTTDGHTGSDVRNTASDTDIYNSANKNHTTDTYTINVKGDIFSDTVDNQQNVKAIEYVSELNPVIYDYSVKFNYTSRQYGDQAFTKAGTLTPGQINDETVVTGTLNTEDKKLTKEFLAKIAPHESNFNEKITWDFDSVVNSQTCNYNSGNNTYTISLTITSNNQTTDSGSTEFTKQRHGYFTVPYVLSTVSGDNGIPLATNGKVSKAAKDKTFTVDADYDEFFKDSQGNFVTAPSVIYDGETARYFKYWEYSIVSGSRGDSRVVGKCYYHEFNYRAFNNYNITAVYSTDDDGDMTETSYADLYKAGQFTTIDFIGNTRNQWNNNDNGDHTYYAGDLVYNDFIMAFKPQGDTTFNKLSGTKECGFIIQRLKEIETNASGTNAKTLQEYAKDYSDSDLSAAQSAAKAKAGGSNSSDYTQIKVAINPTQVNDKNRCHYAYAMWNTNQRDQEGTQVYPATNANSNTKYLYRAYSYMKIGDGDYIMSEKPAYFYMYDIAQQ